MRPFSYCFNFALAIILALHSAQLSEAVKGNRLKKSATSIEEVQFVQRQLNQRLRAGFFTNSAEDETPERYIKETEGLLREIKRNLGIEKVINLRSKIEDKEKEKRAQKYLAPFKKVYGRKYREAPMPADDELKDWCNDKLTLLINSDAEHLRDLYLTTEDPPRCVVAVSTPTQLSKCPSIH